MKSKTGKTLMEIEGKKLQLSNLDKVFWKDLNLTKADLIDYYLEISDFILPYLRNRLQVLHRNPNGIEDQGFYQKNITQIPEWIKTIPVKRDSDGQIVHYVTCDDKATLIYLVNLGCIEVNIWSSRINRLNSPDYAIIDLDPLNVDFEKVITAALAVKEVLDELSIKSYCKTSGKKGLHILIPLGAAYSFEQTRNFAQRIAFLGHQKLPDITSLERFPVNRDKKVYLDYLQNSFGQTIVAPYSLRPIKWSGVSTPLNWSEVKEGMLPTDFNIKNAPERFRKLGDLFSGLLNPAEVDLNSVFEETMELL